MVSGIWRRIRSALGSPASVQRPPKLPDLPFVGERGHGEAPPTSSSATESAPVPPRSDPTPGVEPAISAPLAKVAPVSEPAPAPPSVEQLAESLAMRLTEDETLRGSLSDDEFQPLLDWAQERIGELATVCGSLPPAAAAAKLGRAGDQLVNLLRTADLAIGERREASPGLVVSRFQMLDTLLQPPLLEGAAAHRARTRLEAFLSQPVERLQQADGAELARQLSRSLG